MNNRKLASHLAKAIIELDRAMWSPARFKNKRELERAKRKLMVARLKLCELLTLTGYEFAECDSCRVRKIRN